MRRILPLPLAARRTATLATPTGDGGRFGLECADQLEWRGWQPGTEFVKSLVLKNVGTNALKLHYKQTASKAFSMDFPEPFKLRPGMSKALKAGGGGRAG
jgi:hypothetical protein